MAFRLMRLLALYEREEEHCQLQLQRAQLRRDEIAEEVRSIQKKIADSGQLAEVGADLQRSWAWRQQLHRALTEARARLAAAEKEAVDARETLLFARQQRQTLASLKDKFDARVAKEKAHAEQVILDEVGLRLHLSAATLSS